MDILVKIGWKLAINDYFAQYGEEVFLLTKHKVKDMESKAITILKISGMSLLYIIMVFLPSFLGFAGPKFWVFFPVVSAFAGAFTYFYIAGRWQNFGVATLLALLFSLFLFLTGEADVTALPIALALGVVSDIIRLVAGRKNLSGVKFAYPILSLSTAVWLLPLWTRTEWYVSVAVEEMGSQDYADGLASMATPAFLIIMLLVALCLAYAGIALAVKYMKETASMF